LCTATALPTAPHRIGGPLAQRSRERGHTVAWLTRGARSGAGLWPVEPRRGFKQR
jgi:hypothetical protein